jgi:hypothetical protein
MQLLRYNKLMNRTTLVSLGVLVAIAMLAAVFSSFTPPNPSQSVSSNVEDTAIRSVVTSFGTAQKNVSLLAPDAGKQIQSQYSAYVTPELLATWMQSPALAPGRETSSPWPDRIVIDNLVVYDESSADVSGTVIEMTSASSEPAATYPVKIGLIKSGSTWLISSYARGDYNAAPERITITGVWECLPHKDRTGPQTTECALGVAKDVSDGHYGIDTRLMQSYPVDYAAGTHVRVSGVFTPASALTPPSNYDIDGVIAATNIEKI